MNMHGNQHPTQIIRNDLTEGKTLQAAKLFSLPSGTFHYAERYMYDITKTSMP